MFMHKPFSIQKQPMFIYAKHSTPIIGGEHKKKLWIFVVRWMGWDYLGEKKVIQGIASS